jgi:hypothetical protein
MWIPHLSERIHSIGAKTKSKIPWIVREVLLMAKTKSKILDSELPMVFCKNFSSP